ncbi:hypothetical protein [Paraburkholderia acidisoli]|uniref:Uncharacterized protein n=1 Tax=Paraburkholderia acidisoli TaxID=2571748 RepID=A0A7Z2GM09_9BURK|nr:hypothetical protein [Paraburkholderia acidisoli]QGZ64291.1 hypothetical protein FAZ98_21455 [Paraburkholderia acidisoli]
MNVAFPALFIFLVVLPGFLFRQFFQRNEVRTFDHAPFSAVVLKAVLCAFVFDAAGAVAAHVAGYEIELGDIVRLLVGGPASLDDLNGRLAWLNAHPLAGSGYFVFTNGLALVAAFVWRGAVQRWQLDRSGHRLARLTRGDAPWYYLFAGLDHPKEDAIDGAMIAAVVEFREGTFLFTGILDDYEVNADGQLDRLMLIQAQRRRLESDRKYDAASDQFIDDATRFYPIAGDVFVLRYDELKTLNVTYLSLEPQSRPVPHDAADAA